MVTRHHLHNRQSLRRKEKEQLILASRLKGLVLARYLNLAQVYTECSETTFARSVWSRVGVGALVIPGLLTLPQTKGIVAMLVDDKLLNLHQLGFGREQVSLRMP